MVRLLYLLGIGLSRGGSLVAGLFQPVIHIEPGVSAGVEEYLGGCSGILRCIVVQEFDPQVCRYLLQPQLLPSYLSGQALRATRPVSNHFDLRHREPIFARRLFEGLLVKQGVTRQGCSLYQPAELGVDAEHGLRFADRFLVDAVEAGLEALEWLFRIDQEGCGPFDLSHLHLGDADLADAGPGAVRGFHVDGIECQVCHLVFLRDFPVRSGGGVDVSLHPSEVFGLLPVRRVIPSWSRLTANECLGTKAKVQEKMYVFFGGLAHRKDEVKHRCRTLLQPEPTH